MYSRRNFLKSSATAAAASLLPSSSLLSSTLHASIATLAGSVHQSGTIPHARRLTDGWEFLQGSLGGPWEAWHSEEVAIWLQVAMPHCFNAYDSCDPDVPYYRGNGWYRTHVPIANPFPRGRTLLHFEGAGQTVTVYVGEKLAGKHTGGYDEFVFDMTDLVPEPAARTRALRSVRHSGVGGDSLVPRWHRQRRLQRNGPPHPAQRDRALPCAWKIPSGALIKKA
jgi:beta-galactosidase